MIIRLALVLALGWTFTVGQAAWALFESSKTLSDQARISMIEAIKTAEKKFPGKPIEAKMGKDEGRMVYEVELIDKNNKNHWVYVDAQNGSIVEAK
jgi:uncharacterized membrane protein YkoI